MTMHRATIGSLVFTAGIPGVVAGLIPYLVTSGWIGSAPVVLQACGAVLLAIGSGVLAHTLVRFVVEGMGTPFPAADALEQIRRAVRRIPPLGQGLVAQGNAVAG